MGSPKKTISYRFDSVGNRVGMTDPDGGRFTYVYDAVNRMSHLVNPQGDRTTYAYDPGGRRTVKKLANGTRASFSYDAASNLTRLANLKSDGTTISSFNYNYDRVGNRTAVLEADGSRVTWSYDNTYQLTGEHRTGSNGYQDSYTYDASGNRLLKIHDGARTTYSYDAANQLEWSEGASGRTTYTFDADGNQQLVVEPTGDRTTTSWDYENRTTLVQLPSGIRNTMAYEPGGLRVKLEESAGTKKFVWDDQNYLAETDENDDTQVVYTNEPRVYGNLVSQRRGTDSHWYCFDVIGSTRELTDSVEAVTDTRLYDAWGVILAAGGSSSFPFQFIGQLGYYFGGECPEYYIRARIMLPDAGRWSSRDPDADRATSVLSAYLYASNAPLLYTDPSGRVSTPECCCCCVESMSLRDIVKITRRNPQLGVDLYGHRFTHHTTLSRVLDPAVPPVVGDCTFEWFECATSVATDLKNRGAKPGEWYDVFDLMRGISETGENWEAYFARQPPYDRLPCPGTVEINAIDDPQIPVGASRILKFAIKVTSAPDCPCFWNDLIAFATQTLAPSHDVGGRTVPEIWDFREGLRAPVPPGEDIDCGKIPFKQSPQGIGVVFD